MLDPIVDAALIGLVGVFVGIGGYALQNWQVKKADRERAEFVSKRERYEEWIRTVVHAFHIVQTKKEPTPLELKEKLDVANNMLSLYGSDDVVKLLHQLWTPNLEGDKTKELIQKTLLAMRKDLVTTGLDASDVELLRAE